MAEQTSQEPTMEEILASIRRIISEDDAPAAKEDEAPPHGDETPLPEPVAETAPAPEPEPEPEPEPVAAAGPEPEEDDALELTEKVETHGDLDVYTPEPAAAPEPPKPAHAPESAPVAASSLISDTTAAAAASAFGKLEAAVLMPQAGRTLEDVVREMLRPMLQQWLDDNLPGIVAEAVQAEVERIARGRVR